MKYPVALNRRIYAFSIDLLIIVVIHRYLLHSFQYFYNHLNFFTEHSLPIFLQNPLETLLLSTIIISYFTLSYYISNGKTLGKYLFKLQVISLNKSTLTLTDSFIRANGYFFCFLFFNIPFILPFISKTHTGIPDWLSRSNVTNEPTTGMTNAPLQLEILPAYSKTINLPHQEDQINYFKSAA